MKRKDIIFIGGGWHARVLKDILEMDETVHLVGGGCHIGTGAKIVQGVRIADHTFIKAGEVITSDVCYAEK